MVKCLEMCFSAVVIGVSFSLIVIFLWFFFGLVICFWKIYVRDPSRKEKQKKKECKHSSCCYEPTSELWVCNDCDKNFI